MTLPSIPNLKHLAYGGAEAVVNPTEIYKIRLLAKQVIVDDCLLDRTIHEKFVVKYREWILSSTINRVIGLENFPIAAYSNGATEAFDKFYLKNHLKKSGQ